MSDLNVIDIERLRTGVGCLDVDHCIATCGAAQVALTEAGHPISVSCEVTDQGIPHFMVELRRAEMDPLSKMRSWRQRQRLGEWAAEGIAFLMIESFTPFTVVDQSEVDTRAGQGTGIDYYLGAKEDLDCEDEDDFPEHLARLEVSGILGPSSSSFSARVTNKIERSKQSDGDGTPAYIIVVDFGPPVANFTKRMPDDDGTTLPQEERSITP